MADFISLPFYDLFHENGHVPKVRENLPPLPDRGHGAASWKSARDRD